MRRAPLDASDEEIAAFNAGFASTQRGWTGTFEQLKAYLASLK